MTGDGSKRPSGLDLPMDLHIVSGRNRFAAGPLQRQAELRRDADWLAQRLEAPETCFIPVWRSRLLVQGSRAARLHRVGAAQAFISDAPVLVFLGEWDDVAYFAADFSDFDADEVAALAPGAELTELRQAAAMLPAEEAAVLAHARAMVYWHHRHRFCGRCGATTRPDEGGYVRICTDEDCGRRHFPRTDPAIIVLASCGDACLLGRQAKWPPGRYSTIAGFVEPGESAEDAVIREVLEETGVRVSGIRYHSSQPWPFPASLMLGYFADVEKRSEPHPVDGELEDARWFTREQIRDGIRQGGFRPPPPLSVAYHLIEDWFDEGSDVPLRGLVAR